jgi:hypothetical protein
LLFHRLDGGERRGGEDVDEVQGEPQPALPGAWIDGVLRQIANRLDTGEQRYDELKSILDDLYRRISTVEDKQVDLDHRLRTLQRLLTEQRRDVTEEEGLVHLGLASEYTTFVSQRLLHIAHQLVEGNQPDRGLRIAQAVAVLCRLLFGHDPAQTRDVLDGLGLARDHPLTTDVDQITRAALHLRQQADQTSDRITWDFTAKPRSRVHGGQRTWGRCDPSHPVQFVVAPAYRVNGTVFSPQLVYTSSETLDLGNFAVSRSAIRRLLHI